MGRMEDLLYAKASRETSCLGRQSARAGGGWRLLRLTHSRGETSLSLRLLLPKCARRNDLTILNLQF